MAGWDDTEVDDKTWNQANGTASDWKDNGGKENHHAGDFASENTSKHVNGEFESAAGGDDRDCRNCGQVGHIARECPEPKQMTGECFNCGQVGHNKADCTNEKIDRPFTGECRSCGQQGHRSADCPSRPPDICRNCLKEGHKATECTEPRSLDFTNVADMTEGEAWKLIEKASSDKDLEDFQKAIKCLAKANREITYLDIETKLRKAGLQLYLVALEKDTPLGTTLVNLQGKQDCHYAIEYRFSAKPKRAKFMDGHPETPAENLERLADAGEPMKTIVPVCRNCDNLGHTSKHCPEAKVERERIVQTCGNCGDESHRYRECPNPRVDKNVCRNCNQPGHRANECTEPRSAEGVECKRCNEMGHFAKDCPNNPAERGCRNCGKEGHIAKECDKPRNPDLITCRNCDEKGHMSRECPKPRDYSRVKCSNCGEMGHTQVRCKQPAAGVSEGNGDGGFDNGGSFDAPEVGSGGWETGEGSARVVDGMENMSVNAKGAW